MATITHNNQNIIVPDINALENEFPQKLFAWLKVLSLERILSFILMISQLFSGLRQKHNNITTAPSSGGKQLKHDVL